MADKTEVATVACMLQSPEMIPAIRGIVQPSDFSDARLEAIYKALSSLTDRGLTVDRTTLVAELDAMGSLGVVGEDSALGLFGSPVDGSAATSYAKMVREASAVRAISAIGRELQGEARKGADPVAVLGEHERKMRAIHQMLAGGGETGPGGWLVEAMVAIDDAMDGLQPGIPTGLKALDEITLGLQRTDLAIVAGRPSMGKSSLTINNLAVSACENGVPAVVFSMEMASKQVGLRLLSSHSGVPFWKFRKGMLSDQDLDAVANARDHLAEVGMYIDQQGDLTPWQLESKIRWHHAKYGVGLVVVDFLQLMSIGPDRDKGLGEACMVSKGLAKELDICVLMASQLSRASEKRDDKRPILSDLRDSGQIEQAADLVVFCHRPAYYSSSEPEEKAELIVAKQRNGAVGTVHVDWIGNVMTFCDQGEMDED